MLHRSSRPASSTLRPFSLSFDLSLCLQLIPLGRIRSTLLRSLPRCRLFRRRQLPFPWPLPPVRVRRRRVSLSRGSPSSRGSRLCRGRSSVSRLPCVTTTGLRGRTSHLSLHCRVRCQSQLLYCRVRCQSQLLYCRVQSLSQSLFQLLHCRVQSLSQSLFQLLLLFQLLFGNQRRQHFNQFDVQSARFDRLRSLPTTPWVNPTTLLGLQSPSLPR